MTAVKAKRKLLLAVFMHAAWVRSSSSWKFAFAFFKWNILPKQLDFVPPHAALCRCSVLQKAALEANAQS